MKKALNWYTIPPKTKKKQDVFVKNYASGKL